MLDNDNNIITNNPPVTIEISRSVKPGKEVEFEKLIAQVAQEAKKFPGYLGTNIFKPNNLKQKYRVIFKFDSLDHFHAWETSKIRLDYYTKIQPLIIDQPHVRILTGLETWFTLSNHEIINAPPRYKMAIVSWLAIYPLVILILEILNPILVTLPIPIRAAVITLIAIPTMTYVLMPNMAIWFSRWLYPKCQTRMTNENSNKE